MALSKHRIFAGLYLALEKCLEGKDQLVTQQELGLPIDGLVMVDRENGKTYVVEIIEVKTTEEPHLKPGAGKDTGEDSEAIKEALKDCFPYVKAAGSLASGCHCQGGPFGLNTR